MKSRYARLGTRKTVDGKTVYRTRRFPNIPLRESDIYIATETGDRLDTLAKTFYNDPNLWWIIASANNIHNAVFGFEDGTVLRIPVQYIEIVNKFTE